MDTCGVCGKQRAPELKFSRIKDGWLCIECLRASGLTKDYPDYAQRDRVLKTTPAAAIKERVEKGQEQLAQAKENEAKLELERAEREAKIKKKWENRDTFPVTTADIDTPYEVIGPVFFQTSNKGLFSSAYGRLAKEYRDELDKRRIDGMFSPTYIDWGFFTGLGWSVGQNDFDPAFYIAVEELKRRAIALDADAIVGLKVDFDLDTNGFQFFYLQSYGTAVRFKD